MTKMTILPSERKFVRMVQLMDTIISDDIENVINSMVDRDPRLVCRLNFKNKEVSRIIRKKINSGDISPFDLMYDTEDTFSLDGISRTESDAVAATKMPTEDETWLQKLNQDFEEKTRRIKRSDLKKKLDEDKTQSIKKKLDESHDDLLALT